MRSSYVRRGSLWVPTDVRCRYVGRSSTPRFGGGVSRPPIISSGGSSGLSIPAQIQRFDGGSGSTTITNGVAFRPGDLTTTMLTARQLRVFVGGVEQAVYVEALNGRHPDGSVKVVLIQFIKTFSTPLSAEIRLGEVRPTNDIVKQTLNASPDAWLFPTNTAFLCAASPFWQPLTPMSNRPQGTYWDTWEQRFRNNAPFQNDGWTPIYDNAIANGPLPGALIFPTTMPWMKMHYEFFAMTGEAFFLNRGCNFADIYINQYAQPNNWGIPEEFMCASIDAAIHYWMTGITTSRDMPLAAYATDPRMFNISAAQMADRTYVNNHGRMHYNKLMNLVIGHHLQLSSVPSWEPSAPTWAAKAQLLVDSAITQQFADGHNTWPDEAGGQQNWEVFQRDTAVIAYFNWVNADSRIHDHILAGYNYINNTYWFPAQIGWSLADATGGTGSIGPTLNGFGLEVLAWLYRRDGTLSFKTRGDDAVNGVINGETLDQQGGHSPVDWGFAGQNPKVPGQINWGLMTYIAARQGV